MAVLSPTRTAARWRWRVQRWLSLPGAGPALLLLALAAVAAAALWWVRAGERLDRLQAAQRSTAPAMAPAASGADERRQRLAQFHARLPAADDVPLVVQALFDGAERQGLRLLRGSYRLQPEPAAGFDRYRMDLPVRGEPARVQRFIEAALLAWPTLAVEGVQFKRDASGERVLEARVQWVLFVRAHRRGAGGSPPASGAAP